MQVCFQFSHFATVFWQDVTVTVTAPIVIPDDWFYSAFVEYACNENLFILAAVFSLPLWCNLIYMYVYVYMSVHCSIF